MGKNGTDPKRVTEPSHKEPDAECSLSIGGGNTNGVPSNVDSTDEASTTRRFGTDGCNGTIVAPDGSNFDMLFIKSKSLSAEITGEMTRVRHKPH